LKHWAVYKEIGSKTVYVVWAVADEQEFVFSEFKYAELLACVLNVIGEFSFRNKPR